MQSFRTELENPIVERDILELERKIRLFREGKIDEEKFRSLRLARGVYGQRQPGVQMIRIKLPFGRLSAQQLRRIADVADEYAHPNLHLTTRQDIQIHYVSLERTPELWAKLEQDEITLREACGNTVRNITASPRAGVDPEEPFDVSPYADTMFRYFLRNPVCQEMGRKFKIAFSSSESDSAFTFIHDLGFIPQLRTVDGVQQRGFKVLIGGGLGAQPHLAEVASNFLEEDRIIPFTESVLRVFDRYGERKRRHKARLKFLLQEIGLEALLNMVKEEEQALPFLYYPINTEWPQAKVPTPIANIEAPHNLIRYDRWLHTNVLPQKQKEYYSAAIRVPLGNFSTDKARALADLFPRYAADDMRITVNQGLMLRFVPSGSLTALFNALDALGFAEAGADSTADITACPGTDTCNLGISSSTGISQALEAVMRDEFPDLIFNNDIKIKISGCPNSCGQHGLASIGFHGSSMKVNGLVMPALQVLLGGKVAEGGAGRVADKVIKVPSKRDPDVLRYLLNDYDARSREGEYFSDYYLWQGEKYFYSLLKPLTDTSNVVHNDFLDWGSNEKFELVKAVGECAGVIIDLFQTLLYETEEKLGWAAEALAESRFPDAIYHAYNAMTGGAKAYLLSKGTETNSQHSVMQLFDEQHPAPMPFAEGLSFKELVLQINKEAPSQSFALRHTSLAQQMIAYTQQLRENELADAEQSRVNSI